MQAAVDRYDYLWLYSVKDMRNTFLKEIRNDFKTSRFFYGKNRVMAKALGNTVEEEYKPGLSKIAKVWRGGQSMCGRRMLILDLES